MVNIGNKNKIVGNVNIGDKAYQNIHQTFNIDLFSALEKDVESLYNEKNKEELLEEIREIRNVLKGDYNRKKIKKRVVNLKGALSTISNSSTIANFILTMINLLS